MSTSEQRIPHTDYRDALRRFGEVVHQPETPPEEAAALIDAIAYPPAARAGTPVTLDRMAELMAERLAHVDPGYDTAFTFMQVFRAELGFQGNREEYDDPDNSFLCRVLERRTGLPILLSLICVALGRRLGLEMWGLGFPGHFMAALRQEGQAWLLDPFNGQTMALAGTDEYLSALFGQQVAMPDNLYDPCTTVQWSQRILNNLRNVYRGSTRFGEAACVLDFMLAISRGSPSLWRERALLHHQAHNWEQALYDLRRYFCLRGHYSLVFGPDAARAQLLRGATMQDKQLFAIYQKVQDLLAKSN